MRDFPAYFKPDEIEKEVESFWSSNNIYHRAKKKNKGSKQFFFVDGPPYTTGRIHLGTAWNKIIKDSVLRYLRMKGFDVLDRPGWDMHGLPIEVKVENELGFESKKEIEAFGVDKFIARCMEYAINNMHEMAYQFKKLGVWMDWDNPYKTISTDYIRAAWWTLKRAYDKGLVTKGKRVVNWCPRCETAIADAEVEYWDETDPSIFVKFPLKEGGFIVVWTTTPWTLPANMAVAVHPSLEYARIKAIKSNGEQEELILAKELIEGVMERGGYSSYEIVETYLGEDLVGMEYQHPLEHEIPIQRNFSHRVYMAEFVSSENTGCVHVAPGHGHEDWELGMKERLKIFCPVKEDGKYTSEAGKYEGLFVKEADPVIIQDLRNHGYLLAEETITHRYGHCWRCKTPILYLATEQWFLKISEVKELMLNEVDRVKWFPVWAGSSRFKDWVSNARDWCISRQRYWGIPIPIWECQDGHIRVVESPEELGITDEMQLHRPAIDEVILTCKCGKPMKRIPDVFDVWFDSGVASWATIGYPKNSEGFEKLWPADFITEGHDQTRGWFYSQLGTSAVAFGKAPYKKVLMHGFTLDEKGRKMSKSLGNVVAPEEVIERVGVDAFRLYVLSSNAPWEDIRFNWSEVENAFRTLNILWNSCRFAFPYMKLDDFRYDGLHEVDQHFLPEDRWIISRVQALAEEVSRNIEVFEFHRAIRTIEHFILEDLSRWYIQLVRPRAWEEKHSPTKLAGYNTIIYVMDRLLRIIAPFTPYISEKLYQTLIKVFNPKAEISVHLTEFPKPEEKLLKPDLEKHMKIVREAVEAVLGARQKGKRKLRWPIERVIVETKDEEVIQALKNLSDIFLTQTNARNIEFTESWKEYELSIRPNYKVLGPVFKEHTKEFFQFLMSFEPKKIKEMVEQEKEVEFRGNKIILSSEMVEIDEELPEYLVAEEFSGGRVLIDLSMTEDILKEGFAREITRRIQDMRKEMDLRVEEFINVWIEWDGEVDLKEWESYISNETRAKKLHFSGIEPDVKEDGFIKKWEVEGKNIIIGVKRA